MRSLYIKSTSTSNTEKSLAFLVESGALYLCIWVHSNPLIALHQLIRLYTLTDRICVEFAVIAPEWGAYLPLTTRPICCKTSLIFYLPSQEIDSCHQGLYPTAIVVVVTMRLSTADMLSRPGTSAIDSPMVFKAPSPSPQTQLVEGVRSSVPVDGSVAVVSTSAASTRTLASSFSDK